MTRIRTQAPRILIYCAFAASILAVLTACGRTEANANNEANVAFEQGEYNDALEEYERVSEELPERPEPDYNSANARYRLEDYEQAEEELERALLEAYDVEDEDLAAKTLFNLGNVLFQMGEYSAAIDQYGGAIEQYREAIEAYKQVLRDNPDDVEAKHNLELALSKIEEQEEEQQQQQEQQQQDQEQQGEGDQPGSPDQPDDEGDDEQEGPEGEREGVGEDPEGEQRGDGSEQESQEFERPGENPQQQEMTPAQALQFLEAVGQSTDTLQSYLQMQFAPSSPPERDW